MGIDLGAIAKGYAADEVVRVLKPSGVKHALINMGGNVIVIVAENQTASHGK